MMYLGDFPTSHVAVCIPFDSFAASTGAPSATSNFAAGDVLIYKDGSVTQRTSSAGITVSTSFDSLTGIQMVVIDLSDNTDAGFYAAGHEYVVVIGDITIDAQTVRFVAGAFSIERAGGALALLKAGTAKVDVTKWLTGTIPAVNVAGVPLVDLKYTLGTISPATAGSVRADAVTGAVGSVTGAVGSVTGAVGSVTGAVGSVTGLTASDVGAIKAKTDNLTAAPADETLIIAATNAIMARIGAPVGASISADIAAAPAAVWAVVIDGTNTAIKLMRGAAAVLLGKASGLGTTNPKYRDVPDTKDVISATCDADGNRSAMTRDLT